MAATRADPIQSPSNLLPADQPALTIYADVVAETISPNFGRRCRVGATDRRVDFFGASHYHLVSVPIGNDRRCGMRGSGMQAIP